ncbi:uncharacterized protein LOC117651581 [Thrips palmi]|uniref:Uncharacterized protein LOC117651581 n=1 Tax=Thrips palmi TaxID=161013 RepID=A0A6P9A2G1_THRPL|nr:uncharacterized protein LOC117651581 [Thrips palmi]
MCNCKKTLCSTKQCKCRKTSTFCSEECGCSEDRCQNRPEAEDASQSEEAGAEDASQSEEAGAEDASQSEEAGAEDALQNEEAGAAAKALAWADLWKSVDSERELLESISHFRVMPKRLAAIMEKRKGDFDEMTALLAEMNGLSMANAEELTEGEWKLFEQQLVQCTKCERKFHQERIEKHEGICQRRTFLKQ